MALLGLLRLRVFERFDSRQECAIHPKCTKKQTVLWRGLWNTELPEFWMVWDNNQIHFTPAEESPSATALFGEQT